MKFTITPLGGAGRGVTKIVDAILRYLQPKDAEPPAPGDGTSPLPNHTEDDPAGYYVADGGEGSGRWLGRGAVASGLVGDVDRGDFGAVLAGRDPATGGRLLTAQGSAGRRPKLGVGTETRRGSDGEALYDARDAGAVLGLPVAQVRRMLDVGAAMAMARFLDATSPALDQPEASYVVPRIEPDGTRMVSDAELSRCEDALQGGASAEAVACLGEAGDLLTIAEAARLAGVTPRYLRRLAQRYRADAASIDDTVATGRQPRQAYLRAHRDARDRWVVARRDLAAYLQRRRPPAVRVGYDLTLTTEKSLGVLALLSGAATRGVVLESIQAGNDWAVDWLERHAAVTRAKGKVVPAQGWTVASFRHLTSRALDPFPHHHNVVAAGVEDRKGVRRALDARQLYRHTKAASALATAEMRYQLTTRLGVRWRPGRRTGWEVAGISDAVLREFSSRRNEIEDALRELEDALGHGAHPDAVAHIALSTRPAKQRANVDELLAEWWRRAETPGLTPAALAGCTGVDDAIEVPDEEVIFELLAGQICQNVSVFNRGDVLATLVNLPIPQDDDGPPRPLIVQASELEALADAFLRSAHVEEIAPGGDDTPTRYSTREMLAVQDRIVARFETGLHSGRALVPGATIEAVVRRHPHLTDEQRRLVRAFCASGHAVQCAIGRAGTGKTSTMAAAADAWEEAGMRVLGTAVKGEAARILASTTGIPAETLAWYLAHEDPLTAPLDARTVLVVDEASTVSDTDLDRLGWLADQTGATLRLIGDPAQHGAVEAGGMFRVLCERHPGQTPELIETHRLADPHDRAAADALRSGQVALALDELDAAGHLHIIDDDFQIYVELLGRWWKGHQAGQHHPMVNRDNRVRRQLNQLAHTLLRANGEIGVDEIAASGDRHFAIGDRVIARAPDRGLTAGRRDAYIRNGATGTVIALHRGGTADDDELTIALDGIGSIDVPRRFFDRHEIAPGHEDVGVDHAYAVTSYAVQGATYAVSASRIDPTSTRAETYVDITRGTEANHLYLTRSDDPLDGEHLPRTPPDPIDHAVADQLESSIGERTAWEIRQATLDRASRADPHDLAL